MNNVGGYSSVFLGFFLNLVLAAESKYLLSPLDSTYSVSLSPELLYRWQLDGDKINVEVIYLSQDDKDWIAVGYSDHGELTNADFCIFWTNWKSEHFLQDVHTDKKSTLVQDEFQDCQNPTFKEISNGEYSFSFTRKINPCHGSEDYSIEDGTTHIVWARGNGPLYEASGLNISDPDISESGFTRTRLLKVDSNPDIPKSAFAINITHKVDLSDDDTTYWCSSHRLQDEIANRKHHIIQYEPHKTEGNSDVLHHMEVFYCDSPSNVDFPIWSGPCGSDSAPEILQNCKKVLAAWAIGAGPLVYPNEAGVAIGGPDINPYIMLEVHYNNPSRRKGIHDESGMKFIVTPELREHDVGIMELGLIYTDLMAIPPKVTEFSLNGHCLPQCTAVGIPEDGITIFASQLHTHLTGTKVSTRHLRNGKELPEINRDNHYSTHFQEIRLLREPRLILPGDHLLTTCVYDTSNKTNVTVGGFSFMDEMCVNYIHYYPTINLEICKSSADSESVKEYFRFLNEWDNENTSKDKTTKENYVSIRWSPLQSATLKNFYDLSPEMMQCMSGSGHSLPGKWKGMSKPLPGNDDSKKDECRAEEETNFLKPEDFNLKIRKKKVNSEDEAIFDDDNGELWPSWEVANDIHQFNPSFTRLIKRERENRMAMGKRLNKLYKTYSRLIKKKESYPELNPTFTRLIKKKKEPADLTKRPWSPKALRMKKGDFKSLGEAEDELSDFKKRMNLSPGENHENYFYDNDERKFSNLLHYMPKTKSLVREPPRKKSKKLGFLGYIKGNLPNLYESLKKSQRPKKRESLDNSPPKKRDYYDYDSWGFDKRAKLGSVPLL